MSKGEIPSNNGEQFAQEMKTIVSALQTLAVAIASLPGAQLQITQPGAAGEAESLAHLQVAEGSLTISYRLPQPSETGQKPAEITPAEAALATSGNELPLTPETLPKTAAKGRSGATKSTSETKETDQRVTLSGRLGTDPFFKTTSKGTLIARFPLAVPEPETEKKVRWQTCVAFGKYAEKVQGAGLHKGQSVQVTGYLHELKAKSGGNQAKATPELYAVVVRPVNKPNSEK